VSEPINPPASKRRQIWTRTDWDRALDEGWLTRAQIEDRLHNIAVRDLGELGPAGYSADGFFTSLVADGIQVEGIGHFVVHSNDHDPPHVHVQPFGQNVDLRFSLETGELLDERPRGVKSKQVKNMTKALFDIHDELGAWWEKAQGVPVVRVER
jgi:hypothetical protein